MQPHSHTACYKYLGAVWLVNILRITLKILASSQEIISFQGISTEMNYGSVMLSTVFCDSQKWQHTSAFECVAQVSPALQKGFLKDI